MKRLSTKTVVVLAAVCFTGLVILQVVWMLSAYEGEAALHARAKKQFEVEFQAELAKNEQFRAGLRDLLDHYNQHQSLGDKQKEWFYFTFLQTVAFNPQKMDLGVYIDGASIVQHQHDNDSAAQGIVTIASDKYDNPEPSEIREAGKLCIHCILGVTKEHNDQYDYQILLFYKNPLPAFFEKLGFLILLSFILLIVFGYLFRKIMSKYNQEKKLSEAKNDFINNLTHELQTPVFAIQMANRLIKDKTPGSQELTPLTQIIEKEAGQLKQHAARILELASLERAQVELTKELTDMNTLIDQKRPTIQLMLQPKNGKLDMKLNNRELYSEVDPVHFNNILVSLADNAIKYNENEPHIIIETGEMNGTIFIKFSDNGIGINKEYLPYVADKFFRVPGVKRHGIPGFGLGLSYAKHIVDLHGGQLKITSEEGKGTMVTILLPKATAHA